jgi:hypothetical protein
MARISPMRSLILLDYIRVICIIRGRIKFTPSAVCYQDGLAGSPQHGLLHSYFTQVRTGRAVLDSESRCAEEIFVGGKGSQFLGKKRSNGAQFFMFENPAKQDCFD